MPSSVRSDKGLTVVPDVEDKQCQSLALDHNKISSLQGLQSLVNLRDLDLSFNAIVKLEPHHLQPLTCLSSLSLYSNKIVDLSGLPALPALSHLSIGRNALLAMTTVTALQKMKSRRSLVIHGNPMCEVPGCYTYVLAQLRQLLFLDSKRVTPTQGASAIEKHQDEVQLDHPEKYQAAADEQAIYAVASQRADLQSAHLLSVSHLPQDLLDPMMNEDVSHLLHVLPLASAAASSAQQQLTTMTAALMDELYKANKASTAVREALMADMDAAAKESSLASWRTVDNWEDRVRDPLKELKKSVTAPEWHWIKAIIALPDELPPLTMTSGHENSPCEDPTSSSARSAAPDDACEDAVKKTATDGQENGSRPIQKSPSTAAAQSDQSQETNDASPEGECAVSAPCSKLTATEPDASTMATTKSDSGSTAQAPDDSGQEVTDQPSLGACDTAALQLGTVGPEQPGNNSENTVTKPPAEANLTEESQAASDAMQSSEVKKALSKENRHHDSTDQSVAEAIDTIVRPDLSDQRSLCEPDEVKFAASACTALPQDSEGRGSEGSKSASREDPQEAGDTTWLRGRLVAIDAQATSTIHSLMEQWELDSAAAIDSHARAVVDYLEKITQILYTFEAACQQAAMLPPKKRLASHLAGDDSSDLKQPENLPDIIGRLHVAQVRLLHRATDQSLAEHTAATAESIDRRKEWANERSHSREARIDQLCNEFRMTYETATEVQKSTAYQSPHEEVGVGPLTV